MMMKLCCFCEYFYLDMGTPDYSQTPGEDAVIQCNKDHWEMSNGRRFAHIDGVAEYRTYIQQAETCMDYKETKCL